MTRFATKLCFITLAISTFLIGVIPYIAGRLWFCAEDAFCAGMCDQEDRLVALLRWWDARQGGGE